MAELRPYPFGALVRTMLRELEEQGSVFHLPRKKFVLDPGPRDWSVRFHGRRAGTPFGPAAGPQSQMAQNLALSWLAGSRILELKTVQIRDDLEIPRPCIDMATVGYNVEWSQELRIEASLEEYVKGAMLVEILRQVLVEQGHAALAGPFGDTIFDMSVGYDLAGIRSSKVLRFIHGMMDATEVVERLRAQIPPEHARFRDLPFPTRLSDTLTLSTFHGCPPEEIEAIIAFLLREVGLHCVIKLNPTLLGPKRLRTLLHERMGYHEIGVPDAAFEQDTRWEQMVAFTERLCPMATTLGLGLGVKLTNTLIVRNHRDFFPKTEEQMYLSGAPLHVLAMDLLRRVRAHFGDLLPISFSAGIDRKNFPDAVSLGLVPVTVCSDLLKPGGYARAHGYFQELATRMDAVGASTLDAFVLQTCAAHGEAPARLSLPEARLRNTERYVDPLPDDPRYGHARNRKPPRKIDSHLLLFDCITCDKCLPVCPNDANFTFPIPAVDLPIVKMVREDGAWMRRPGGTLRIARRHQIGNFADFCNECGNCDVFCPEHGGPYVLKPRFFGSLESWRDFPDHDGFLFERRGAQEVLHGRFEGRAYRLQTEGEHVRYAGPGFVVRFRAEDPEGSFERVGPEPEAAEVDLTYYRIMDLLRTWVAGADQVNYVTGILGTGSGGGGD